MFAICSASMPRWRLCMSAAMRHGMISFLQGAMTRDTTRIVTAMKEMGFISLRADPEVFDRVVHYFHDKMRAQMSVQGFSLKDLSFDSDKSLTSLLDLRDLNVSLADLKDAFHIPKEWILLERTLLLLLGVCTTLDPEMNPTDVIQPYLERFLLGEKKQWSEVVLEASRALAPHGADRFYHLVETGYYDDSRFYRVIQGRFVQFGIAGKPEVFFLAVA